MASELPPAYDSLHTSTATATSTAHIDMTDELVPNCNDGTELVEVSNFFEYKNTRIGFIQKVLTINLLQLFLMAYVMGICLANSFSTRHPYGQVHLIVLSTLAFLATSGLLIYCTKARRENPYRYLFLVIHPLSFTFVIAFLSLSLWVIGSIFLAFVTYIGGVFSVLIYSVFALQTKLEFAAKHAIVLAGAVQILIYAITVPFMYVDGFLVLYVGLALSLHYIYLFWDLEIMTSKKYWHDITPDNFVDGALNLQLDYYYMIINRDAPNIR